MHWHSIGSLGLCWYGVHFTAFKFSWAEQAMVVFWSVSLRILVGGNSFRDRWCSVGCEKNASEAMQIWSFCLFILLDPVWCRAKIFFSAEQSVCGRLWIDQEVWNAMECEGTAGSWDRIFRMRSLSRVVDFIFHYDKVIHPCYVNSCLHYLSYCDLSQVDGSPCCHTCKRNDLQLLVMLCNFA